MRPLFCRILKSGAPLARAIFLATGYAKPIRLAGRSRTIRRRVSFQGPWGLAVGMEPDPQIHFNPHHPSFSPLRLCLHFLFTYQNLAHVLIGNVGELCAVELGDHELCIHVSFAVENTKAEGSVMTQGAQRPSVRRDSPLIWTRTTSGRPDRTMRGRATTHRVAATQRLDVEEGENLVALEELEGGDVTCQEAGG